MARDTDTDNEAELRLAQLRGETPGPEKAHQEAREPAPTEANPLSEPEGRPNDRRKRSP